MALKVLIIQTAFIGDVVLSTSLLENLHVVYPGMQLDFLLRKGNEGLLYHHPFINKVLVWDKKQQKNLNLIKILATIRKEKYDQVINVQRYASTGFLTAFSGAKEKIGFDKNPFSFLFTKKIKHLSGNDKTVIHETERNHQLIKHLTEEKLMKPRLYPTEEQIRSVAGYVQKPFITLSPASVWFTKQYPPQKWASFINRLSHHYRIYLLGGKDDRSLAEALIQMTGSEAPVNLCGELNFLQSAALMQHAVLNYVNDSAPMHFASAMNAPVAVVYCSTLPAFGYGPLSDIRFIIEREGHLYCRPCGLHGHRSCPEKHFKCAMDIREDQLLKPLSMH